LWHATVNSSEEQKELAWRRIADSFGFPNGTLVRTLSYTTIHMQT